MIAKARLLFALAMAIGLTCRVGGAQDQGGRSITYQLRGEAENLPPYMVLNAIWNSSPLLEAACRDAQLELLGSEYTNGGRVLQLKTADGDEFRALSGVVHFEEKRGEEIASVWGEVRSFPADTETLKLEKLPKLIAACDRLSEARFRQVEALLSRFSNEDAEMELRAQEDIAINIERRRQEAVEELAKLRAEALLLSGKAPFPASVLEKQLADALAQRQSLQLEEAGLKARRNVVEMQIAELDKNTKAVLGDDEVLKNLQKVIELRQREVEIVKTQIAAGRSNPRNLESAEVQLVMAQAELAEARREAAQSHGAGAMEHLELDLVQTIVKLEEGRAKLEFINKRIDEYQVMQEILQQRVQPLLEQIPAAQRRVEALDQEKMAAEAALVRLKSSRQQVLVRRLDPPAESQQSGDAK